jgi:hypothetical protein
LSIDLNINEQLKLLNTIKTFFADIDFKYNKETNRLSYYYNNDQFPKLDADILFALLLFIKPKNYIEIGSGFSSLIVAEVNKKYFNNKINFLCIEPFPRQFLINGVDGISELIITKLEDIDVLYFNKLLSGDILFVDSSHVSKIGSDVNFLFFEILPRLNKGVYVHFHDIFLPDEYPKLWAIEQGRNWNEQYLLRAFLQYNNNWRIIWASHFIYKNYYSELVAANNSFKQCDGGSFWIQKK